MLTSSMADINHILYHSNDGIRLSAARIVVNCSVNESNAISMEPLRALAAVKAMVDQAGAANVQPSSTWTVTLSRDGTAALSIKQYNENEALLVAFPTNAFLQESFAKSICRYVHGLGMRRRRRTTSVSRVFSCSLSLVNTEPKQEAALEASSQPTGLVVAGSGTPTSRRAKARGRTLSSFVAGATPRDRLKKDSGLLVGRTRITPDPAVEASSTCGQQSPPSSPGPTPEQLIDSVVMRTQLVALTNYHAIPCKTILKYSAAITSAIMARTPPRIQCCLELYSLTIARCRRSAQRLFKNSSKLPSTHQVCNGSCTLWREPLLDVERNSSIPRRWISLVAYEQFVWACVAKLPRLEAMGSRSSICSIVIRAWLQYPFLRDDRKR